MPRAPLHAPGVTLCIEISRISSAGITPPSSLIRTHAPIRNPPQASVNPRTQGLCRLLSAPAGSRTLPTLLRDSFSACKDPYPGCSRGAHARFFPQDNGLPGVMTRSALSYTHTKAIPVWSLFRGCSHSITFQPADLLAPQIAPTAGLSSQAARAFTSPHISVCYLAEQGIY